MKYFLIIIILLSFSIKSVSQDLKSIIKNKSNNYYEINSAFKQDTLYTKTLSDRDLKEYGRWERFWRTRVDYSGDLTLMAKAIKEFREKEEIIQSSEIKSGISFSFNSLGPQYLPLNYTSSKTGQGLVRKVLVNPNNQDSIYAAANNGGLWFTEDGGDHWECKTDNTALLIGGVSDFIIDPNNFNNLILCSRVRAGGEIMKFMDRYDLGIFETSDGGLTWSSIPSPNTELLEYIIKIDRLGEGFDELLILTNKRLYKSTNHGTNWTDITSSINESNLVLRDFEIKPNDENKIYLAGTNFLYITNNGGSSWSANLINNLIDIYNTQIPPFPGDTYFGVATKNSTPNEVFLHMHNGSQSKILKSSNSGSNWTVIYTGYIYARQYVDVLEIAPNGDIYAGGLMAYRSGDEFLTKTQLNNGIVHDDIRSITFVDASNPNIVYMATDGGINKSTNYGSSWANITGDLAINEFYDFAISESDPEVIIGGTHDNGPLHRESDGFWNYISGGGDGNSCEMSNTDHSIYYFSRSNSLYSSLGGSFNMGGIGYPVALNQKNPSVIYCGKGTEIYKNSSYLGSNVSLNTFQHLIHDIEISPTDTNNIFVAAHKVWKSSDAGSNWTALGIQGLENVNNITPINDIDLESNGTNIWIAFSGFVSNGKIFRSVNGGNSWSNHTESGLPNFPVQSFVFDEKHDFLFVGTDIGLYYKHFDSYSWNKIEDFPTTIVTDLEINHVTNELYIGTYGRGIWKLDLDGTFCPDPLVIDEEIYWNNIQNICSDIVVANGGKLTVTNDLIMSHSRKLTVENGGELIIYGATVSNANFEVLDGGKLTLLNNCQILLYRNDKFIINEGAELEHVYGDILVTD
jgi:photosystem II stability/assembly factor-like uncharacterized protein